MSMLDHLKTKASFFRPENISDGEGGYVQSRTLLGTRYVGVEARGAGRLTIVADQPREMRSLTLFARRDSLIETLNAGDIISVNGQYFDIEALRPGLPDDYQNRQFYVLLVRLKEEG